MDSFVIFQQLLVLFGLMALGFACTRRGWMNEDFNRKLSALVVNLFNPMIQLSGAVSRDDSMGGGLVRQNLILCCIYFGAAAVLAFVLVRLMGLSPERRGIYQNMLLFGNFGFMGIPIITGLFGSSYVIFVNFYMLFMNTLFYTYGLVLMTGSCSPKKLLNGCTLACLVSILIFACDLRVPAPVESLLRYGGNTCIPLSRMVIGSNLAGSSLRAMLRCKRFYVFTVLKLLVMPILLVLAVRNLPFDATMLCIFMVMAAMPSASVPALTAQELYGAELGAEACQLNMITTVCCLFTVPIVSLFL